MPLWRPLSLVRKAPKRRSLSAIGGWEDIDWTQVTTFEFGGKPYLLLYKGNKGNANNAYVAPIVASANGPKRRRSLCYRRMG